MRQDNVGLESIVLWQCEVYSVLFLSVLRALMSSGKLESLSSFSFNEEAGLFLVWIELVCHGSDLDCCCIRGPDEERC